MTPSSCRGWTRRRGLGLGLGPRKGGDDVMDFALSEEQLAIQESARQFATEQLAPNAADWDAREYFPRDVVQQAAGLGMAGIYVRDDVGGSALSRLDAALIFEALSTGDPSIAAFLSIHNMCAWMVDKFGSEAQRRAWLPKLCAMDWIASYCL